MTAEAGPDDTGGGVGAPARRGGGLARFLQSGQGSLAGAAGIVAFGFAGSRLLGIVRSVVIADAFGTEPELAAYWVAFRLPDLVFQVLAGATLSAAFIPTFSNVMLRGGQAAAWRLASAVLNLVSIATGLAALAAFVLAPQLVPLLAPGLGDASGRQPELQALAVELTRIMLLSPVLFGVSGMVTGILNARQHFWSPALAPVVYNASIIFGTLFLVGPFGTRGLAIGVVAGAAGHLLVQLPALRLSGMRWRPALDPRAEGVREVARLVGPRVIGLAAAQANLMVVIFFASFISDAAISAVSYGFLMAMLPVGVTGMAISTAVFPTLARQGAARQLQELRQSLSASLRMILFLAIPASVGLILLARPAVRLLFQRGAFDAASTDLVVATVTLYGAGIFAHAGIEILSRGFYALSDTRTPVQVAVLSMLLNVALCAALVAPFGVRGLAAAASIAIVVEFAVLLRLLHTRLGTLDLRALRRSALRTIAATALMAEVVVVLLLLLRTAGASPESARGALVLAMAGAAGGFAAYTLGAVLARSEEYASLAALVRRR